ncbi:hypothetical protein CFC21_111807 [Triticum aestivum]|nr:dirigent protein 22 [Aegilops tauschii subsp. strangulata]XP_044440518.1 dirigent protein 22-like [Triticum aestivum]KAF7111847.1 hypothetical protein CFC21_111807 [Triticum aestivum]
MAPSSQLLTLVLLLLAASAAVPRGAALHGTNLKRIRAYMHQTLTGPNATEVTSVQSPLGGGATFGQITVLDNELRDGPNRWRSSPLGRFQGLVAEVGLAGTPGLLSAANVVFTAGRHRGSTLAMLGTVQNLRVTVERSVVGGTGEFRMARGYSSMVYMAGPSTPNNDVYMIDFFVHV